MLEIVGSIMSIRFPSGNRKKIIYGNIEKEAKLT